MPDAPPRGPAAAAVQAAAVAIGLGAVATASVATGQPMLLPSLAACLFLQLLLPEAPAARPRAVVGGQLIGLAGGVVAVHLLGAAHAPVFGPGHPLDPCRAGAVVLAALLTLAGQRLLAMGNAAGAALAATLALGDATADAGGAVRVAAGIVAVALLGEAGRRLVLRADRRAATALR